MISLKNIFHKIEDVLDSLNEKRFIQCAFLAYFIFVLGNLLTHEMWADEIQAWLIARDSTSLSSLIYNLRYEGHPPLWHISLYLITRVTHNMIAMQFLHLAISATSAFIILKYSLFTRLQKVLIIFGYYFIYEYAAISRNYAFGIMLVLLFSVFFRPGIGKNYIILAVILFFLSMTSAYGFLIVIALSGMMLLEFIIDRESLERISGIKLQLILSICIIILGLWLSAIVMKPAEDSGNSTVLADKINVYRLQVVVGSFWKTIVPIPRLGRLSYWNTNIIHDKLFSSILTLPLLGFFLLAFSRNIIILFLFLFMTFIFMAFQYFVYPGFLRHSGHYYIILIICFWFSKYFYSDDRFGRFKKTKLISFCDKNKLLIFNIILFINVCVGIFSCGMEYFRPFTISPWVAGYIVKNDFDKLPILAYPDFRNYWIGAYLEQPLYYPQGDRFGTFILLDKKRQEEIDEKIIIERAKIVSKEKQSDILFVLTGKLENRYDSIIALREFHSDSILDNENFYLYVMKKNNID